MKDEEFYREARSERFDVSVYCQYYYVGEVHRCVLTANAVPRQTRNYLNAHRDDLLIKDVTVTPRHGLL